MTINASTTTIPRVIIMALLRSALPKTESNLLRDFRHAQIFSESSTIWAFESPDIEQVIGPASHFFDYWLGTHGSGRISQTEFQPARS